MKWKVVIYHHTSPESINEEPDPVVIVRADFRGLKESLDDEGVLTDGGYSR